VSNPLSNTVSHRPSVLFVCVKNGGKSQMAAGIMRQLVGDQVEVHSAGTRPGVDLNDLSVSTLHDVGVDISAEVPKPVTPELVMAADLVVTLGREATVEPVAGTQVQNWDTDEPSERGIEGVGLLQELVTVRVRPLGWRSWS
jgi:arsenate-mycothiol transferase